MTVFVFDAYGTLFDVHSAIGRFRNEAGTDADRISDLWRAKQLEYIWTLTLAGKYGIGIISLGSMSTEGLTALPTQWAFAEAAAKKAGTTVDRKNWRVLLNWHIAETREKAIEEARHGLYRWHNEYVTGTLRPNQAAFKSTDHAIEAMTAPGSAAVIGTPDDLVKMIKSVYEQSGGFGTVVGFVHDWANPENTFRSWDMVARYVVPEINGYVTKLRESQKFLIDNRSVFERAQQAIMSNILQNKDAAEALKVTSSPRLSAAAAQVPDFGKGKGKQAAE